MIVRTDVFIMSVLHPETSRNDAKLGKAKAFIQMSGVGIRPHDGIELKNAKAESLPLRETVQHQLFSDMQAAEGFAYRVAGVADVAAAADVVGMQDVKSQNLIGVGGFCDSAEGLFCEKRSSGLPIQQLRLRECDTVLYNFVPYRDHSLQIRFCISAYQDVHKRVVLSDRQYAIFDF